MATTITYTGRLTLVTCTCGLHFAIPEELHQKALDHRGPNGTQICCPVGHRWHYLGKTDAERERERARQLERRLADERDTSRRWRDRAEAEARSAAAYKGHLTRAKKRIANGVCPVPGCKRSGFERVMAHIAAQHPDWLHNHPEIREEDT